ncbi:MAG: winged helix DNA-binding domain-containing protein [Deltaproteobacteria bacterium]|nr:winged helix DNA-binding domain-containing protein [Deltaproteobacteria bacterium]
MADVITTMTLADARRAWSARQHLGDPRAPSPALAELVGAIGWVPLPVGAAGYLALHARGALTRRAALDSAIFDRHELSVVPGPRGAVWLVPTAEAPLARAFAVADHASREARLASACALTARDLESARDALRAALGAPVTLEALRSRLPAAVTRSLGDVGRRAGSPTLAGMVLRGMWCLGEVQRLPVTLRLDDERYRYALEPYPRRVPSAAEAVDLLAPRWLRAHAPTTARAFALAFGVAAGRAQAALKPLKPRNVAVEGFATDALVPEDFVTPPRGEAPGEPLALLGLRDPWLDAHPDLVGLATPAHARAVTQRAHGPGPAVVAQGQIVGTWSWDPQARAVSWRGFDPVDRSVALRVDAQAESLGRLLAELDAVPLHSTQTLRRAVGSDTDL